MFSEIKLGEKVASGRHRDCYEVQGEEDWCVKVPRPKKLLAGNLLYNWFNINKIEYNNYLRLPAELQDHFPLMYQQKDLLVVQRMRDYDGQFSRTLQQIGPLDNVYFWQEVDGIVNLLMKFHVWFFDVFYLGNNLMAQKIEPDRYRPIIIDGKRQGWRAYPGQINLLLDHECRKKFLRRLDRFRHQFQP